MFNRRTSMSGREYSPGVLIGNWNEDVYLEEECLKDFLYRRERGELLIQRSKKIKEHLYKKEQLSVSKDGFIHFGDTVMLLSPDNNKSPMENYPAVCGNLSLAVNPDEASVHRSARLPVPCGMSACKTVTPAGRNVFQILSTEGEAMGEPVRFGQNFGLGTAGGFPEPMLFLASDHKTFINMAKKSSHQSVFMTDELSYLASWQATFLDPQYRMEYEGFPVPANTKILIIHSHTNQGLAIPRNFWICWSARRSKGMPSTDKTCSYPLAQLRTHHHGNQLAMFVHTLGVHGRSCAAILCLSPVWGTEDGRGWVIYKKMTVLSASTHIIPGSLLCIYLQACTICLHIHISKCCTQTIKLKTYKPNANNMLGRINLNAFMGMIACATGLMYF
ncbi:cilia- and flagella-associated protein 161 isoform X1 [Varanus komodoensis]|uniref:cilia- and flagella-associated protein 161 isoform X1 n=1 Tax=Varanus komodoensis TaxID=61221 RepID=UPI001CF7B601|nr:cilia- and flagella-associated protein 161 isoform X1 [Varanus komodoensis]